MNSSILSTKALTLNDVENLRYQICVATDEVTFQKNFYEIVKPLLIEVAKNNENRNKILELICHINKRIRSARSIAHVKLEQFIDLYNDETISDMASSFVQMYIKICYPKYELEYRMRLLSPLLASVTEIRNQAQKDFILHLVLPTLQLLKVTDANRKSFEMANMPYQRQYIIEFLTLILLIPYNFKNYARTSDSEAFKYPDGMNSVDFNRIIKNEITSFVINDDLEKTKCGIANFLAQRIFPDEEVVAAVCTAQSDTRHTVVAGIDREAKLIYNVVDWEKSELLNLLLDWYIPRLRRNDPDYKVKNARCTRSRLPIQVQTKIGALLMRSKITLPNTLVNGFVEAACATILDVERTVNSKQIEIGFAMVNHICIYCNQLMDDIAERLLTSIAMFMQKQLDQHESNLKSKALNLFPIVLQRNPSFLLKDMRYLSQLFDELGNQLLSADLRTAFKDCINAISGIFNNLEICSDKSLSLNLENILNQYFDKSDEDVRITVVNFVGKVFPSTHVSSRFLLLEALGDSSELVKEAARNALKEVYDNDSEINIVRGKVQLPSFVEFVNHHGVLYKRNLFNDPLKLIPVVEYIRMCILAMDVGLTPEIQSELTYTEPDDFRFRIYRNLIYFVQLPTDDALSPSVKKALETYCKLVQVIYYTKNHFMSYLEEIVASSPQQLLTKEGFILQRTMTLMYMSTKEEKFNRDHCASVFSLLCIEIESDSGLLNHLKTLLSELTTGKSGSIKLKTALDKAKVQGNTLGFCYLVERILVTDKGLNMTEYVNEFLKKIDNVFSSTSYFSKKSDLLLTYFDVLVSFFRGLLALARCGGLKHMKAGKLPASSEEDVPHNCLTKAGIIMTCLRFVRQCQNSKIREVSLAVLAGLCLGEENADQGRFIMDRLIGLHNSKDILMHPILSRVLVAIVLGSHSSPYFYRWFDRFAEKPQNLDIADDNNPIVQHQKEDANWLLERLLKLLEEGCSSSLTRLNVAVWCREVVTRLGHFMTDRLPILHSRLLIVLGDKDEIAQDAASMVLSEIYKLCGENEKNLMTEELMQVILHGKRGKLGSSIESNSGFTDAELESRQSNQATYRELCSLASELNQPGLIYSFMLLVSSSGESGLGARAAANSFPLLLRLVPDSQLIEAVVPKLFRYLHDPDSRTQRAMKQVWNNLSCAIPAASTVSTADTTTTTTTTTTTVSVVNSNVGGGSGGGVASSNSVKQQQSLLLQAIPGVVTELTKGMASTDSRIRQASCSALSTLLSSIGANESHELLSKLSELIEVLIRVMDDSKQESREAALEASKSFEKFCFNILEDPNKRQSAEVLLNESLVTVLLNQGLTSKVNSVVEFTIRTLGAIVKSGRVTVRQAIPRLAVTCLHALSSHDHGVAEFISQQLAGAGNHESRARWDAERAVMTRQSPLSDILSATIQYVDEETQARLVVPLADTIRSGVGLATKVGTAEYLVDLAGHCGSRLEGTTGKWLAALLQAVVDPNETVQKEMARAIGCLAKVSKRSSIEKLLGYARTWYLEQHESERHQWACCYVFNAVERHSPGTLAEYRVSTFPLVFLAKQIDAEVANGSMDSGQLPQLQGSPVNASTESAANNTLTEVVMRRRAMWSETWIECTSGAEGPLLMRGDGGLLEPVLEQCIAGAILNSTGNHSLRSQGALALRTLVRIIGRPGNGETRETWVRLYRGLVHDALVGCSDGAVRWWPGKIYLLHAVMSFVRKLAEHQLLDIVDDPNMLLTLLEKETSKSDLMYRCAALEAVGKVSDILQANCLSRYLAMLTGLICKGESQCTGVAERETLVRVVGRMWPNQYFNQDQVEYFVPVIQLLTMAMEEGQWKQQIQALKSYKSIFYKTTTEVLHQILNSEDAGYQTTLKALRTMLKPWKKIGEMTKYKQLRESCIEVIDILVCQSEYRNVLRDQLKTLVNVYCNDSVQTIKEKATSLLQLL